LVLLDRPGRREAARCEHGRCYRRLRFAFCLCVSGASSTSNRNQFRLESADTAPSRMNRTRNSHPIWV
jgi:hypothetical protein